MLYCRINSKASEDFRSKSEMTEDIFVDHPGDLGDDFSLGSSIDDINFIDAFNNQHNNGDDMNMYTNMMNEEKRTAHSPITQAKLRGMTLCSDNESKIDEESMRLVIERYSRSNSPRKKDIRLPVKVTSGDVRNGKASTNNSSPTKHPSFQKAENIAIKARRTSAKSTMKHSKSDGLFNALKAKYRRSSFQESRNTSFAMNERGGEDIPALGRANASWNNSPVSPSQTNDGVNGRNNRRHSLPSGKISSMHDLLRQSKTQYKSQLLLRQSSAQSLSRRNSLQSINFASDKLDVSSLMPAKQYSKSRSSSSGWFFPDVASPITKARISKNLFRANDQLQQPNNNGMDDITESLLHDACRLFPNSDTVVETALRMDGDAVRRSVIFTSDKEIDNHIYGYPINLALTHGAREEILKLLVEAGPDVLVLKDGADCGASLGIALSSNTCTLAIVELLLSANHRCAQIADRRGNYPLHIAVNYGSPLEIIMRLYAAYPKAQGMRNFHSQTPLDIAIQSSRCPEEVTDFLRSVSCQAPSTEQIINNATKTIDANLSMGFLEEGLDDIMEINC